MPKTKLRSNIIIVIVILLFAGAMWFYYPSKTGSATLSWSANTESDLAGYKIYYSATPRTGTCPPGGYPQKVDVGNKTSYAIDKLEKGRAYYFSITSYDATGNESCFSSEVKKIISTPKN